MNGFLQTKQIEMDYLLDIDIGERPGMFDPEMGPILTAINAEPYVITLQSCYGHNKNELKYDLDPQDTGIIWLYFEDYNKIPDKCPFKYELLDEERTNYTHVIEIKMPIKCLDSWKLLLKWIRNYTII